MKKSLILTISSFLLLSYGVAQIESQSIIEDPSIKKVCNDLNDKREKKKAHRQALTKLLKRNNQLKEKLESKQQKVLNTILRLNDKIDFEIKVANSKIQTLSEQIIRSGCPPIDLEGQIIDELATQDIVKNIAKQINIEKVELEEIENSANTLLP